MIVNKEVNAHFNEFLFDWDSQYYFLVGGYGSSKSYHIALKIVLKLLQETRTCLVVREVYDTIRDSCYALFAEICDSLNLEGYVKFTRSPMQMIFPNGSKVIFRGLDKPAKLKSIHNISLIWLEECSEIHYNAFKELVGRLRHPYLKLYMILSTNPVARSNWTYQHFFKKREFDDERLYRERIVRDGDIYYHHSVADDNMFLPPDYLGNLEEMKTYDPDLYRVARLGRFGINGVRVLPQFEVMPHENVMAEVAKIPARFHFAGCDFGFETSYDAVIKMAVDDENKWLYIYDEFYKNHLTLDQLAKAVKQMISAGELLRCDSAEPRSVATLKKAGINAVAAKKWSEGGRHARLANLRKVKSFRRIICSDACTAAIKELAELTYKKDKNDDIINDEFNIDSHCLSAIEYGLDSYSIISPKYLLTRKDLFGY